MVAIEHVLQTAASRIRDARVELTELLPNGRDNVGFGPAHAVVLYANVAANLKAAEYLINDGMTSSAAIVLRTFVFGSIRLAWFAAAETPKELEARVVAFQQSSLQHERGLLRNAKKSGGEESRVDEFASRIDNEMKEVHTWKSSFGIGRRQTDEMVIAARLGGMGGLITTVSLLNQYVHINRAATNASVNPQSDRSFVIGDRPQEFLVYSMVVASMQALAIATESFLTLIDADKETIEEVRMAGQRWVKRAIDDGLSAEL